MKKNLKNKKGFTLIELIIVIAILGILAAIAIPKFGTVQKDAKIKADISSAKTIANTTQMLITKEEIALPNNTDIYKIVKVGENDEGVKIENALQAEAKPEYDTSKNEKFYVVIKEDGGVNVYAGKGDLSVSNKGVVSGGTEVYPHNGYEPDTSK